MQYPSLESFAVPVESLPHSFNATLQLQGLHCANCVAAVERTLSAKPNVQKARVNFTTHILDLVWHGEKTDVDGFASAIRALGYGVAPVDKTVLDAQDEAVKPIVRALAWAGFGTGNIMIFAAPVWFAGDTMDEPTRQLLHWLMALIALVVVPIAGQPFFKSAWAALKAKRTNMDVPISVGVILSTLTSLYGLVMGAEHVFFDAGVMLLFFLLIGRYLDAKMRAKAKGAAASVLSLLSATATVLDAEGKAQLVPLSALGAGSVLQVAAGERIMADGEVVEGAALLDTSLLTGETAPQSVAVGGMVTSGAIPLDAPLKIRVTVPHESTLLAQIVKTMQAATQEKSRYVQLAEKIARAYTPVVHVLAALTLAGWLVFTPVNTPTAIMYAVSVLIITCPCALGLAVPVVQIIAASALMKKQVLVKTADALERLSQVDMVAFDKTGTLTLGKPQLVENFAIVPAHVPFVLALASASSHPLSRALAQAYTAQIPANLNGVREVRGKGMEAVTEAGVVVRLGSRAFIAPDVQMPQDTYLELWVQYGADTPYRLAFADAVRVDAAQTIQALKHAGKTVVMLSGDRVEVAQHVAQQLGITQFKGGLSPLEKADYLKHAASLGHKVLMVGDGLNDAPSLASAHAAISPASGMDITQNAADAVFLGEKLMPVAHCLRVAGKAQSLVVSNFRLAIGYNMVAIPLAMFGYCTPMVAAVSMSLSSILVVANALRLLKEEKEPNT